MTNFRVGDRIRNIKAPKSGGGNFGEYGEVVDVVDGVVYVEYDNGDSGQSSKPEQYYQIANNRSVEKSFTALTPTPKPMYNNILKTMKRMTMGADEKALVDSGLKTECGTYTEEAISVVLQDLCATADAQTRLVEVATAILADRKEKKDNK